ncbi:unnamed protein product [Nippostrongylus brasiliensis]|uniref:DEK_C domain-containing protein n=1 Tax=Nippostrongylus brasiliensis TaxID=27835 RepID=A0A0N4XEJ7_NIPBR|nr:unnamed protein product [Nippostrongylus brasiliensis]
MAVQLNDSSDVLECCLHAKTDQYANLAVSKSQARGSSIQDEVIDRLARQLRVCYDFPLQPDPMINQYKLGSKKLKSLIKKEINGEKNEEDEEQNELKETRGLQKVRENSGICGSTGVVKDSSHSGGACCKLNESVSVSMTTTPKKKSKEDDSSTPEPSDSVKKVRLQP